MAEHHERVLRVAHGPGELQLDDVVQDVDRPILVELA